MARKTSSRVGCFSTYSTLAGGSSCLSSARVPFTMIRPSWRIAIRSASCSASSRYCVVSSTVVPRPASSLTACHTSMRACGVEPGGRLVEEDDRRVRRSGSSRCRGGGACRPSTSPPCAPAASVSEKRSSRSSAIAPGSLRCRSRATSTRFSRPVRISSTAANCPVRLIDSRTSAACVATSKPLTLAVPASALSSVDRIFTTVVLPAPFEPSRAKMLPARHVEVDAAQHVQVLVRLLAGPAPGSRAAVAVVIARVLLLARASLDRLDQPGALLVDPPLAGVGLRRTSRRTRRGRRRRSRATGVPSAAARSQRSARSSNIVTMRVAVGDAAEVHEVALDAPRPPCGRARAAPRCAPCTCLYCFFCSSDPVTSSIHFAAMVTSPPSWSCSSRSARKLQVLQNSSRYSPSLGVERVDLARRALLGRDLLHVDEAALLDPDEQRVDGALGDVGEALLAQPRRDLVAVRRTARPGSRGRCPPACP